MFGVLLLILAAHAPLPLGTRPDSPIAAAAGRAAAPLRLGLRETEARIVRCGTIRQDGLYCGSGVVVVRVLIEPDGRVGAVTALTGSPEMKRMAEEAVARWEFQPVTRDGAPCETSGAVVIRVSWRDEPADSCDRAQKRLPAQYGAQP